MFAARMLLSLLMAFSGISTAQAAPGKIEEVAAGALVKVSRAGSVVRLKKGDSLNSGDEVVTDADTAVDIRLEDDTLVRVGINSTYKIEEDSKINSLIHRLLSGAVRVLVPKSETKSSAVKFRLFTPEGTIGVRGTEFVVLRSTGKTQLKGLDGTVMFGPADASFTNEAQFVNVSAGFHSTVLAAEKAAGKPEKFDLAKYKLELGAKNGLFGPLAARVEGTKTHLRASNSGASASAQVALAVSPKKEAKAEVVVKKEAQTRPNYQKMLMQGALAGDLEKVTEAIEVGHADINSVNEGDEAPLLAAMMGKVDKQEKVFMYLIGKGADVNVKNRKGKTPLMVVAEEKYDMEYAEALIAPGGADIYAKDKKGRMVDEIAEEAGYTELVEYLAKDSTREENDRAIKDRAERNRKKK